MLLDTGIGEEYAADSEALRADWISQDNERTAIGVEIERRIPELTLIWFGGAIPYQAWGTLGEYNFYFRSRGCIANLRLSTEDAIDDSLWTATKELTEEDEFTEHEDFAELFIELMQSLSKTPFRYEFEGYCVHILQEEEGTGIFTEETSDKSIYHGWGNSPEEAYAGLFASDFWQRLHGSKIQQEINEKRRYSTIPNNADNRVFLTDQAPIFVVLN